MNILVTLDARYIPVLRVMLCSLLDKNPDECFTVYVAHSSLSLQDIADICAGFDPNRLRAQSISVSDDALNGAPIEKRYPKEMYYRLFAARFLPESVDRILYLDPDLVVLNPVKKLYEIDFGNNFFAAASHVRKGFQKFNDLRLDTPDGSSYVNSGVMMMNIKALRKEQNTDAVLQFIEENKAVMLLPDQDVLNALYHDRIIRLDALVYNLSEKYFRNYNLSFKNEPIDVDWVRENTVFMHYCGRNKPWKENYLGKLDCFYLTAKQKLDSLSQ